MSASTQDVPDDDFLVTAFTRSSTSPRPSYAFQDPHNIAQELSQIPLFMTELPENAENNIQLQALQELLYEGTPEEIAENFREQGNERYKEAGKETKKRSALFKDAVMFYSKGLEQSGITVELTTTLLLNRAAANMALQNYGLVKKDCLAVLEKEAENVKARMRLAKAHLLLGQLDEAEECLEGMPDLEGSSSTLNEINELKSRIAEDKSRLTPRVISPVDIALDSRGLIKLLGAEKHILSELPSMTDIPPVIILPDKTLVFPVILLYPQYGESDFIRDWEEDVSIREQLQCVFESRAPWDTQSLYTNVNEMSVFMRSIDGGMISVNIDSTLKSLLGTVIKHYDHGILGFCVVPTSYSKTFTSKFST